jgi:bifunctional non-homologous end joining protein LigD
MLQRFPGGIDKAGFYQKDAGKTVPRWIRRVRARKEGGTVDHPVVDDEAALLTLSNLGTISFHRWGSRADELERPDILIMDLDPTTADVAAVIQAARWTRDLYEELDLPAYVQATGSRGLHVVTPLDRAASTEDVVSFASGLAVVLAARHPDELTVTFHKADRGDRLYLDTARNGYAQTAVSPYSIRPRAGAPVATPLEWDELDDPAFRPDGWTIRDLPNRLAERADPWASMSRHARSLPARKDRLASLLDKSR